MNYQQSYPGMWAGPVVPNIPAEPGPVSPEDAEADWIEEQEREAEMAIYDGTCPGLSAGL